MEFISDALFNAQFERWLALAPYRGAAIAELLDTIAKITPGDYKSWYRKFFAFAERVINEGRSDDFPPSKATKRARAFRAASNYPAADFFLHDDRRDPRIESVWSAAREQFDEAIALLDPAGERFTISAEGFDIPAIFYRADDFDDSPRPAILMFSGFDGSHEELLHFSGFAALERGFHVVTFESPGQPTVVREQHAGFRPDWEKVVTPVVDFCETMAEIDASRLGLFGLSFGRLLAPRAAAFERRIKAVAAIDGIYDGYEGFMQNFSAEIRELLENGEAEKFDAAFYEVMRENPLIKWYLKQGMWSFGVETPFELISLFRQYTLKGIAEKIECPVLICQAEEDEFYRGQAEKLPEALAGRATYRSFTSKESAGAHAQIGAFVLMNGVVLDWMMEKLDFRQN